MFESDITIEAPSGVANAKSILEVTILGITNGTEITIEAEGCDEHRAVNVISKLLEEDFVKDNE